MALFRKKKSSEGSEPPASTGADSGPTSQVATGDEAEFQPQPEKARKWFDHAKTMADAFNYESALVYYANGIKLDPAAMSAHEGIYEVAIQYMNAGGKPASGKDLRSIEDGSAVSKFAAAEFAWMKDIANGGLALKALEAAIKANQLEYGHWSAPRVLMMLRRQKKPSKSQFVQAKDLFKQVSAWNEALAAGQAALQIDPADSQLDHEIKDISAQRAMDQGGYDRIAGQEGGFRGLIKDAEKQRQLVESEAIAASQSMEERTLLRAKQAYEQNPRLPDNINQYAQLVKKQGTAEAEQRAYDIYMKGFQDTGEYRFRMGAGDIRIEQLRREAEAQEARRVERPDDEALKAQAEAARRRALDLEAVELQERVGRYVTDRTLKARLGELEFARGNYESAMALLQAAKDEPKLRVRAGHMLGRCFAAEGWHLEAISEFKEALAAVDATERERELAIRYDLMVSLIDYARLERSVEHAREAFDICSGITRKDVTYRDIRAKRKEVDLLIRELTGG